LLRTPHAADFCNTIGLKPDIEPRCPNVAELPKPEVLSAAAYGVFCGKTSFGNVIKTRFSRTAPEIGQPLGV
jgi:hypothetical protein